MILNLLSGQFPLRSLHILHVVLDPLIDGVLALGAVCREVRETLLKGQSKDFHVNVVRQSFGCNKEDMPENEGSEEIDTIGASGQQNHYGLPDEDKKGKCCKHVESTSTQLLENYVEEANVQGEVHVVT